MSTETVNARKALRTCWAGRESLVSVRRGHHHGPGTAPAPGMLGERQTRAVFSWCSQPGGATGSKQTFAW